MTTEELMMTYVQQLVNIKMAAAVKGVSEQEYLNEHPEMLPTVGDKNQTESFWTEAPEEDGVLMFFVAGRKWQVHNTNYVDALQILSDGFSG